MSLVCPKCGSRNLRHSHVRRSAERLGTLFGVQPIRCRVCRTRFVARTWRFADLRYAKCPKCMRMDLSGWAETHYRVPVYKSFLMMLGANPYRCEYCRHNFVSFRQRKERFRFSRRQRQEQGAAEDNGAQQKPDTMGEGI